MRWTELVQNQLGSGSADQRAEVVPSWEIRGKSVCEYCKPESCDDREISNGREEMRK